MFACVTSSKSEGREFAKQDWIKLETRRQMRTELMEKYYFKVSHPYDATDNGQETHPGKLPRVLMTAAAPSLRIQRYLAPIFYEQGNISLIRNRNNFFFITN